MRSEAKKKKQHGLSLRFLQTASRKEAGAINFDSHPGNDK